VSKGSKTIASPIFMKTASPINELLRKKNLTVDTAGARMALSKYTQNKGLAGAAKTQSPGHQDCDSPVEENKTNMIPIANFKSNKLS
jgi:hypothetical protein